MVLWPSMKKRFDFYPRPPRGGRHHNGDKCATQQAISIHALREEGDRHHDHRSPHRLVISIHALREEGDQ